MPNGQFGSKLKNIQNMQNTTRKITKYSRNETILKISHLAKAIAFAKLAHKLKLPKTCKKTILQEH